MRSVRTIIVKALSQKKKKKRERKGEKDRGRGEPEMGLKKVRDLKRLVLFKKAGIWGDGDRCERS